MKSKVALIGLSVTLLSGCWFMENAELDKERSNRQYQSAMDDYRAGRLAESVKGLEAVCRVNPSNSSARFQLACLLQDFSKDYFAAACAYREYLLQQPDSDKAKLAKSRFADCERELAKQLSEKYRLNSVDGVKKQLEELAAARKAAEEARAKLEAQVTELKRELSIALAENARYKSVFDDHDEREDEGSKNSALASARQLREDDKSEVKTSNDIAEAKALLADSEDETAPAPIKITPVTNQPTKVASKRPPLPPPPPHPDSYVVQEGDTLYKIAIRFYGHASAWKRIREANKATISMDGRVLVGQKIVLPQ